MIATWQSPRHDGKNSEELLLSIDRERVRRVLILPALFDEANKMRRFSVQVMRHLDAAGADSFLPDLPGCNESTVPLERQALGSWRMAAAAAASQLSATHFLSIRAGALCAPDSLPGWQYAPQTGAKVLRGMLRARTIAAREAGRDETSEQLLAIGRSKGLTLAGWPIGAEMLCDLETAEPPQSGQHTVVTQKDIGGPGLWLRAEPDEDDAQAQTLAMIVSGEGSLPG